MTSDNTSIDAIISRDWRTQHIGKKAEIKERLDTVTAFLDKWTPVIELEENTLASYPISDENSERRMACQLARHKLTQAEKAKRTLYREFLRRGGQINE